MSDAIFNHIYNDDLLQTGRSWSVYLHDRMDDEKDDKLGSPDRVGCRHRSTVKRAIGDL